jgi:arylsulfatase A-like enzyme
LRYENCISHAPWTIPCFTTIFSGLDPIRHRVVASPWNIPNKPTIHLDDLHRTMPEIMRESGYHTIAIDNLIEMASHPSWFVRGFSVYRNLTDRLFLRHHHVLAEQITDSFLSMPELTAAQPWFGFLHYWDPHLPYNYPRRYDPVLRPHRPPSVAGPSGRPYLPLRGYDDLVTDAHLELIAQYDRSIRYLDDDLARLFAGLDSLGVSENTVVVIVGDHGESMVEHGVLYEHSLLYEPTVHVPLIIKDTSGRRGVVYDICQHHDLLPTLTHLAGIELTGPTTGRTLAPFSPNPGGRDFAISQQDGGAAMRSIRTLYHKLICHYDLEQSRDSRPAAVKRTEFYDLTADPYELDDLSGSSPPEMKALFDRLEAWRQKMIAESGLGDPLLDSDLRADFTKYPGDPVLVEFYKTLPPLGKAR